MRGVRYRRRRNTAQVFAVPAALAIASIVGLVVGLTGEGWRDGLAWLLLALPLVALAIARARRT